jgi:flagellar motor switch protein FliM
MGHENMIPFGDTFFDSEIMEGMLRETFGLESETIEVSSSEETNICQKLDAVLERSLLPIADRLSAYLRLILMQVLPRQLHIEFKHQFQTTYQDLTQLFPRRSYFSMIWVQPHNTVWFMHLDRSLAEGLASRKYNLEFGSSGKRWHEVTDADSGIYLEIGEILRRCFHGIPRSWSQKGNLEIDRFKHMLQPGYLDEVEPEDLYVVQEFQIKHPELHGCLHLGIPYVVIMSLLRDELAA